MESYDVLVIGGGAAGYFGALAAAEAGRGLRILILERSAQALAKVRISGGGRCNVTNACTDPALLAANYPRGGVELRGPFTRFQPRDTLEWFRQRGVLLKTEADGRVFPVSDSSETVIECFLAQARRLGVRLRTGCGVQSIRTQATGGFQLACSDASRLQARCLLLAAGGGSKRAYEMAAALGHTILPPVSSLFSFSLSDARLTGLVGVSVPDVQLELRFSEPGDGGLSRPVTARGALLVTHWGLSGPAVLRLSAWGARQLAGASYQASLRVNWLPGQTAENIFSLLQAEKQTHPRRQVAAHSPEGWLPQRLWQALAQTCGAGNQQCWNALPDRILRRIAQELCQGEFQITGKGPFKDEFVTCGGVSLKEVDFRTMESRLVKGLYFAGEILDIDGLTGGFNFQSAWTTGWIAGRAMAAAIQNEVR
jgi:hypothetical protein